MNHRHRFDFLPIAFATTNSTLMSVNSYLSVKIDVNQFAPRLTGKC